MQKKEVSMDTNAIQADLEKCLTLVTPVSYSTDKELDYKTKFVYYAKDLNDCLTKIEKFGVDKSYALTRWYNFMTSVAVKQIFCEAGAVETNDKFNHDVDLYINKIPFTVKLTIFPMKAKDKTFDMKTRQGRNDLLRYYYSNSLKNGSTRLSNCIYVVCDADTKEDAIKLKAKLDMIKAKVEAYMGYIKTHDINQVEFEDDKVKQTVYSDVIYISSKA